VKLSRCALAPAEDDPSTVRGCNGDLQRRADGIEEDDATMDHDPVAEGFMEAAPVAGQDRA